MKNSQLPLPFEDVPDAARASGSSSFAPSFAPSPAPSSRSDCTDQVRETFTLEADVFEDRKAPATDDHVVLKSAPSPDQHSNPAPSPEPAPQVLDRVLERLAQSAFRRRFGLDASDRAALQRVGWEAMRRHAREILEKRLAPAVIANDGHQTPMRGYPVFKAQHATALCCRQCMQKWHGIAPGHRLTDKELDYAVALIMRWMEVAAKRPLTSAGSASKPKAKAHAGANKQKAEQEPSLF